MFEENKGTAYGRALKLLSKQDYSEFKIRIKLESLGLEKDKIEQAILKLKEEKFLREDRYQKNLIRKYINKGFAPLFIIQKLEQEGLLTEMDQILLVFEEEKTNTSEQIKKLIQKKLPLNFISPKSEAEKQKLKNKILQFVLAKGHDFEECLNHLEENF